MTKEDIDNRGNTLYPAYVLAIALYKQLETAAANIVVLGAITLTAASLTLTTIHLITASTGLDARTGKSAVISARAAAWLTAGHAGALYFLLAFWARLLIR